MKLEAILYEAIFDWKQLLHTVKDSPETPMDGIKL
jgi:hypothetical protein